MHASLPVLGDKRTGEFEFCHVSSVSGLQVTSEGQPRISLAVT